MVWKNLNHVIDNTQDSCRAAVNNIEHAEDESLRMIDKNLRSIFF